MKLSYRFALGVLAIAIGLVALVTPFTPGAAWFIFIGLQLTGFQLLKGKRNIKQDL